MKLDASTDSPYTKEVGDIILKEESMKSVILPEARPPGHCWIENSSVSLPPCVLGFRVRGQHQVSPLPTLVSEAGAVIEQEVCSRDTDTHG